MWYEPEARNLRLDLRNGLVISRMVINMIEQIEQFLSSSAQIEFSAHGDDVQHYEHISRVLKRFDYPRQTKRERGYC